MRQTLHRRNGTHPRHPLQGTLADTKHHRDKPVANHFNQAGHSIHNIRVKGLWLLFTDNASDRKDMESDLIDKLGIRRPGGINEKLYKKKEVNHCALPFFFFKFHFGNAFYKFT